MFIFLMDQINSLCVIYIPFQFVLIKDLYFFYMLPLCSSTRDCVIHVLFIYSHQKSFAPLVLYSLYSKLAVSSLNIYIFVVSRAFTAGAASQAGDADSSRAPGLTSGLQGSVNVHRGALLLVPQ